MNRKRYRLVFSPISGMRVPVAETSRRRGRAASGPASTLLGILLAGSALAEVPVPAGAGLAAPGTTASYQATGVGGCPASVCVTQVGNKAIMNWDTFNLGKNLEVQFRQVNNLIDNHLVQGANFTSLNRIHDIHPSIIAGSLSQAAGQKANVILVNSNGIAFLGGSQTNLNSFTASTLNLQDRFLDNFLPGTGAAQFEKSLDGGAARGFIKVFEGAQITAGSQGRVLLIAPTVLNQGKVSAPGGQVIAAAASKVYLRSASAEDANVRGLLVEVDGPEGLKDFNTARTDVKDGVLDGQAVSLADPEDKLGHVTNLGELSARTGNVTMVGYAVNQLGIARATTSVIANGSVYLLAKDTKTDNVLTESGVTSVGSTRAGRVELGKNSLTEILPETADGTTGLDGATGAGLAQASQVRVLGQDIRMAGGALIHAPAAKVDIRAVDKPSELSILRNAGQTASSTARIHIASGARIDVAGLENVAVSAARNGVEVELRGDELKDAPVNQQGPLRGEKVYVDISRALNNANAGKSTLIAKDSLESYQAKRERTVAERSTTGGSVSLLSEGETIVESGAQFDLSGGSLRYTPADVKTTLLNVGGIAPVDIADANAETRYVGIATRYVRDYGRWNKKEVIDLGQSFRHDPGYTEGRNAGSLDVVGMKAVVMQTTDIQGRTTVGELQREAGIVPVGARLTVGRSTQDASERFDFKLNQRVAIGSVATALPAHFKFGDELVQTLKDTLVLNPELVGENKVAQLQIFSNQAAIVRDTLRAPTGGNVAIKAEGIAVKADIHAAAGAISLIVAKSNLFDVNPASLDVVVDDGVSLTARGDWTNDLPGATGKTAAVAQVDGGAITLATERGNVTLGRNSLIDVSGGAQAKPNGTLKNGNGGKVTLEAGQTAQLGGEVRGYALGKGGTYTLKTDTIQIGGAFNPAALNLDAAFFERGGFADFKLTGASGVEIADDTTLRPTVISRELQPGYTLQPTGSHVEAFSYLVKRDDRVRQAANLSFSTAGDRQGSKIRVGANTKILADDNAKISFSAHTHIDLLGEVKTAGGNITAITSRKEGDTFDPTAAVWLGSKSVLDVSGAARTYSDSRGLTQGNVLAGGNVTLGGQTYVVSEAGSRINVSGAAPVRLDVPNETGGLGRMVGSDAGSITITTTEGALLDGTVEAHAGSATSRGGAFSLTMPTINYLARQSASSPINSRVLSLARTVAAQATRLAPGDAVPNALNGNTRIGVQNLTAAGFERFRFNSKNGAIRLEDGLDAGAGRAVLLRELTLDAPRIETAGGNAALTADTVRLGNYSPPDSPDNIPLVPESASPVASGTLAVKARQIELAGKLTLTGMARAELNGAEGIRLAGGFPEPLQRGGGRPNIDVRPLGELKTGADLVFHGAVMAPATYVQYSILAPGRTVSFTQGAQAPIQPWSAYGSLTVQARDIVQGGTIWAPLGQIALQAENTLTLLNGSLTSVAAAPNSLIPFGKLLNGRNWVFDLGVDETDSIAVDDLEKKSILTRALKVNMQPGAKVNLSGGGDVQGYEFSVGPGGSNDILAQHNTYAILPAYQGSFAPADAQEKFDRASAEAVYLSGVPGLKNGVYTLLPAHYALLPGAYAVRLDSGIKDIMPGQAYSRQDGVRIAAGYLTDTRANAPKDARWQGVQVLTHEQVRARSEFTLTRASAFFADSRNRPQDAGLLSVSTTGSGADALKLDAVYDLAAGPRGRGAQVDISALKLAITSGSPTGIAPDVVALDTGKLNALGADSLFIGGTRTSSGDTTALIVNAETVTLANDAGHALQAPEVILAAKDTVTLKAGSLINAQGAAGDAGHYETAGEGALLRAASTTASFARTGSPGNTLGTLVGETDSKVIAAAAITLDATAENTFNGIQFRKNHADVTGTLEVGAPRINFGTGGTEGISYSQTELNALSSLKGLILTSYSTFDVYGEVSVGGVGRDGKPTLQNLSLQGAGLAGINNSGTVNLRAQNLTLSNPASAAYNPGKTVAGSGDLAILADSLTLGKGDKEIQGFSAVTVTANELIGSGKGSLKVAAPVTLNVARISGERGADQAFDAAGAMHVAQHAGRVLAPVTALGAKWALAGTRVDFDSKVELPSGAFKLAASGGNVELGTHAEVDVAGRTVQFFDVSKPSWGGKAEFISDTGNVVFAAGSKVDVSAAAGGDAGTLIVRAAKGEALLADGSVKGEAAADAGGKRGEGARVDIDTDKLASFSALNTALNSGGFDGARTLRVRTDDVSVAQSDIVKALDIKIAADKGRLDLAGGFDASGEDAGRIELFARDDVNVSGEARLKARSSGVNQGGGDIVLGTRDGKLNLAAGSTIDVSGGAGGQGGDVLLRAPRIDNNDADTLEDNVGIAALSSTINGAKTVRVEGFAVYNDADNRVQAADFDAGSSWFREAQTFMANLTDTRADLGLAIDNNVFRLLPGIEIQSATDLALTDDWSLHTWRYDPNTGAVVTDAALLKVGANALDPDGRPTPQSKPLLTGVLTLRAQGRLNIGGNLSDGFDQATTRSGTSPAALLGGDSWTYRLIAGADSAAADPLAVRPGDKDFTLAAGKLIRTGTGNIQIASGNHINLLDDKSVIYTAGSASGNLSGFIPPATRAAAFFSQGGGDVSVAAISNIVGSPSKQLFNNWLFRQGRLNDDASAYVTQTAWWVRFDQFQQGVGALGGGDVTLRAGGEVKNLSAHAPTQARMASVLHRTGGGTVRVEAGADILGGQYYADRGDVVLNAGGKVDSGQAAAGGALYTILALGDGQARVRAQGDVNIDAVLNPHLLNQSGSQSQATSKSIFNLPGSNSGLESVFSTYADSSGASLSSLYGATKLQSPKLLTQVYGPTLYDVVAINNRTISNLDILPSSFNLIAFQGDVSISDSSARGQLLLLPSPHASLELLARNSLNINASIFMSDRESASIPNAIMPNSLVNKLSTGPSLLGLNDKTHPTFHAPVPIHAGDGTPVRVYAVEGDIVGVSQAVGAPTLLDIPKAFVVQAGRDVMNLSVEAQHVNASNDHSRVQAGRDIVFSTGATRTDADHIYLGGPGTLDVIAARDIDLGTSGGIVSRGNNVNPALADQGADIRLAAGVGPQGVDYPGALDRLIAKLEAGANDTALWHARWLTGDGSLTAGNALAAVRAVEALGADARQTRVRTLLYTALRETGRDSNKEDSPYAGDYARGYAAIELIFPGIREANLDGRFKHYQGDINLFASRVKTESGGNIEWLVPGGDMIVGLANTPNSLVDAKLLSAEGGGGVLGIVTAKEGDIKGFSRGDVRVNQSRILTVGGGDVLLWSSEGDIDAGKGKKTATAVPPPRIKVDSKGNVTLELQGAATGSGIGALQPADGIAGDVDLIAPEGAIDAGDAGIRAGNLNLAAQVVIGADNITVSGSATGTPVADTSAVSAASSGVSNADGGASDATKTLSQGLSDAARVAEELKQSFKPTFISAEVIGHGECEPGDKPPCKK